MSPVVIVVFILILLISVGSGYVYYKLRKGPISPAPNAPAMLPGSPDVNISLSPTSPTPASSTSPAPVSDQAPVPSPPPATAVPVEAAPVPPPPDCATDPAGYYYYYAPDVKAAGVDAKVHWDTAGYKEGRKSCYPVPPPDCATDPAGYYYYYSPDVKAAGVDALAHWNSSGYKEGRKSCYPPPPQWAMSPNTAYYLGGLQKSHIIAQDANTNPDSCKAKCSATSGCKGFFYQARGGINGGGFSFPAKSCVYTNVPLWGASAGMSDAYYLN